MGGVGGILLRVLRLKAGLFCLVSKSKTKNIQERHTDRYHGLHILKVFIAKNKKWFYLYMIVVALIAVGYMVLHPIGLL